MQPETQTNLQPVDDFIKKMLVDKGITDLDPDVEAGLVADLREKLLRQIDKEAILRLSDEKATELEKLLDDPNFTPEQMTQFLENSGVDLTSVTLDTMLHFRNYYLGVKE